MKPEVDESISGAGDLIAWSGGIEEENTILHRDVSRETADSFPVSATGAGGSGSVTIYVVQPQGIVVLTGGVQPEETGDVVTQVDPGDTEGVVLQVILYPALSIVPEPLLLWTGGTGISGYPDRRWVPKTSPAKVSLKCQCGDAYSIQNVWVIKLDLAIAGVEDAEEDTVPGEVFVNSDDDNNNATEDRQENPVSGENDLISLTPTIQPAELTLGQVTVTAPESQGGLALWKQSNKVGAPEASWSPYVMPRGLWVEGTDVSNTPGDKELTLKYTWGDQTSIWFELEDTVHLTVQPRPGVSEAYIKLYRTIESGEPSQEVLDGKPVGGVVHPVLYLSIGPGERAKPEEVTVRVRDMYDQYEDIADTARNLDEVVDLSDPVGWQVKQSNGTWADGTEAPGGSEVNKSGGTPLVYRRILWWMTITEPLGCNGTHDLMTVEPVQFQEWVVGTGWTNDYGAGATAISAAVENVHIKDVTCSNGTIDYFKWDPDGEQALQNPTLNFTIADADPHQYEWIIYFRKTSGDRTWTNGEYWSVSGNETSPSVDPSTGVAEETVTVNLASESLAGHLAEGVHPWCTYTYDIVVRELEGEAQVDRYGLKEPYCMWVPAHPPGQEEGEGHSAWVHVPEEENAPAELRVKYAINDQCLTPNAQDFNLIVVDPLLQERAAIGKPWPDTTGVMHGVEDADEDGQPDGIKVYEFADDDPGGTWRVLWTAQAPCGTTTRYRRTHDAQRMLVANQFTPRPTAWAYESGGWVQGKNGDTYTPSPEGWIDAARRNLDYAGWCTVAERDPYLPNVAARWTGDSLFFFAGHGQPGAFSTNLENRNPWWTCYADVPLLQAGEIEVAGHSFPDMKAFIVFACKSADPGSLFGDLLGVAHGAGAQIACGFVSDMWIKNTWRDDFWKRATRDRQDIRTALVGAVDKWNSGIATRSQPMTVRFCPEDAVVTIFP